MRNPLLTMLLLALLVPLTLLRILGVAPLGSIHWGWIAAAWWVALAILQRVAEVTEARARNAARFRDEMRHLFRLPSDPR